MSGRAVPAANTDKAFGMPFGGRPRTAIRGMPDDAGGLPGAGGASAPGDRRRPAAGDLPEKPGRARR